MIRAILLALSPCILNAAPAKLGEALIEAARGDDRAAVESMLKQGADANAREEDGTTPLAWAINRGNADIASLLIKSGANPDLTSEMGIGPLSLAIANGSAASREWREPERRPRERRDTFDDRGPPRPYADDQAAARSQGERERAR